LEIPRDLGQCFTIGLETPWVSRQLSIKCAFFSKRLHGKALRMRVGLDTVSSSRQLESGEAHECRCTADRSIHETFSDIGVLGMNIRVTMQPFQKIKNKRFQVEEDMSGTTV
ncbi:hypothetical protein HAX54_036505, partial [Datura stramonium]|nr:hypothetical protein [Datura stramonium]